MSISSEINRIKDAKTALIAVIRSKGVEVPDNVSIEQLETYAAQIQQGGGSDAEKAGHVGIFPTDESYIAHPDLYAYDDIITIEANTANHDIMLAPMNDSGVIVGEALIDSDTVGMIEMDIPQSSIAEAIDLTSDKIVIGNTVLGVDGTGGGVTPETPTITVSTGGLITASANGLSKTQQLTTQTAKTVTPTKSSQTAVASGRYTTGAVTVAAIPSQYIVPSGSQTLTENKEYDVTSLASVTVNVPTSGGGGMNVQGYCGSASVTATAYTATAVQLTVAKTGTYKVSWCGGRNTNSGTSGSQLYINNSAYGSAQTSFSNTYFQSVTLNNVSLTAGQTIVVRARARSTSYVMWVGNLIIEQTA